MRSTYLAVLLGIVLIGASYATAKAVSYVGYHNQETGIAFDIPGSATALYDGVNGFDDIWKFTYNDDSYTVRLDEYEGDVTYDKWENLTDNEIAATQNGDTIIYSQNDMARTEVFMPEHTPPISIFVTKHEGTALQGALSADDDRVFRHLVESITLNQAKVF